MPKKYWDCMTKSGFDKWLEHCDFCPHNCGADRIAGEKGYCNLDSSYNVASVTLHRGEEPAVGGPAGICNVFFIHCNMQCVYCQNYQISKNSLFDTNKSYDFDALYRIIAGCLEKNGTNRVGFVSPSHNVPHVIELAERLKKDFPGIVTVYNTNSYEKPEVIKEVARFIDIFLPDFKYFDDKLALKYSKVKNYFSYASKSIAAMLEAKGDPVFDEDGYMISGVIIRHLILPGETDDSVRVLEYIAGNFGTDVYLSLMSQYYPVLETKFENLNRKLTVDEYEKVTDKLFELGFENGWIQDLESAETYLPDFTKEKPFE